MWHTCYLLSWISFIQLPYIAYLLNKLRGARTRRFIPVFIRAHQPVPILSQLNPLYTLPQPISQRSLLIPSFHLRLGLPSSLLPSGFSTLPLPCYIPRPSHSPWYDLPNGIWEWVQNMKLLAVCNFLNSPVTSSLLGPHILEIFQKSYHLT
jgi:hypothetical protein